MQRHHWVITWREEEMLRVFIRNVRVTIRSFNARRRTPHERMLWTGCSGKAGVGADQPFGDGVLSQRERGMQIELLHQPGFVELNRLERHI
ncbi:MAG: hypothetical protein Nkreftii_003043 [Candidatus Nitrospira kreftii]|uniref:Uncharacterized protein n=1 Tax=Candidatus Nitrospira kreftii TaxID=2652173 RepID=A0A7S8FFU9_9BACT|nr:MAG: hypothetical protein Nkreftii_003043 [Candidatus Nitrospira kreftii]